MSGLPCDICGAAGPRRVRKNVRDYVTGDVFRILHCASCGAARTDPVPADLGRYYATRYRSFNPVASAVLRRLYLRRVDGWRDVLRTPGRALEVGAGRGWMLRALRQRGWLAVGTERSVAAAATARATGGAPVFVGEVTALRQGPILDLVVMFHVLEHIADPLGALREVSARMRTDGVLILGIPNLASWQARLTGPHWRHLDVPRHLWHFTPASIERALASTGFRLERIDFRSFEHDPFGWIQSALDALRFEPGILLKVLEGSPRRSGSLSTLGAIALAIPLGAVGLPLALASWAAGRGAVMEVWARRDQR